MSQVTLPTTVLAGGCTHTHLSYGLLRLAGALAEGVLRALLGALGVHAASAAAAAARGRLLVLLLDSLPGALDDGLVVPPRGVLWESYPSMSDVTAGPMHPSVQTRLG